MEALYTGTAFLCKNLDCLSTLFAKDGYNFFNYIPTTENEESENGDIPSYLHNVIQIFKYSIFRILIINGREMQNMQ